VDVAYGVRYLLTSQQIEALHESIASRFPHPARTHFPPRRVFQLHTSALSPVLPSSLIFTWPPSRPTGSMQRNDGSYDAEEYTAMMRGVDMDPSQHKTQQHNTNCTTRYSATHSLTTEGIYRHVTSVFIPYGSLIFACFQTIKAVEMQQRPATNIQPLLSNQTSTPAPSAIASTSSSTSMSGSATGPATGPSSVEAYGLMTPSQEWNPPHSEWSRGGPPPPAHEASLPITPSPNVRQDGFEAPQYPNQHSSYPPQPPLSTTRAPPYTEQHGLFYEEKSAYQTPAQIADINAYPTPAPSGHYRDHSPHSFPHNGSGPPPSGAPTRPLVRPPGNVDCCKMCGLRESPEWRRSETGIKDLCNA